MLTVPASDAHAGGINGPHLMQCDAARVNRLPRLSVHHLGAVALPMVVTGIQEEVRPRTVVDFLLPVNAVMYRLEER